MELAKIEHIETDDPLQNFTPEIFITASGYETRATAIAQKIDDRVNRKIALSYEEFSREHARLHNDLYFKNNQYEIIRYSSSESPDYHNVIKNIDKDQVNILFDISCMTKRWYHSFFQYLHSALHGTNRIHLRIVYFPSEFSEISNEGKFKGMTSAYNEKYTPRENKKTALFLGISQDSLCASKIIDFYKPDDLFLFYSDPATDKRFIEKVFINNHQLIESIAIRNLLSYPINNGRKIFQMLADQALLLRLDHRIVIVPQGPKIFALVSMALQLSYPDIQICYPDVRYKKVADRKPAGKPVILDLIFENE